MVLYDLFNKYFLIIRLRESICTQEVEMVERRSGIISVKEGENIGIV